MTENPTPDDDALRRFLEEALGGAIPEGALDGVDLSELAKQANLPSDPAMLKAAAAQMQHVLNAQGEGPVNWTLAQDLSRRTAQGTVQVPGAPAPGGTPGDPSPSDQQIKELEEAANIASLWLADAISFDLPSRPLEVWTRGTWLHRTQERWQSIVEPVAKYMAGAIGEAMTAQMQQAELQLPGDPGQMMERMGGTLFGVQFGHAIGSLAREVFGTTDLSLPLGPEGRPALVAANVADLVESHGLDAPAARIFLAARELAHTALFSSASWLPRALFSAVEDYARGITLDLDALDEMVRDLDLSDPSALQARRPEEMFVFTRRASQERALEELATTLALVEAWVDHVTSQALAGKLPQLDALREVLRRRRASGSPAEEMLSKTVGIELRPRRVREALAWWESVLDTEGEQARDGKWAHPDLLPDVAVLSGRPQAPATDAPALAADGQSEEAEEAMALPDDIDAELAKLLDEAGSADSGSADGSEGSADGSDGTSSDGTSSDGPVSDGSSPDDSPSDDDPRS
ncbi:zinc-dependent metalloprotease [Brachybacterium sp. ACRRE]|uniref:zinc-dependent metalloprotease n=1 Tax=Brachybacterium sp. ACRRE TaxID=2918184 RepID=UPI001EF3A6AA|nr:zinc-dependent metalloprotease [Brachybacterium sp. ACRRE]MCG7308444.1 zinc-dependent metalloprotease [Brachybacterium sp. ACRRE]